MELIIRSGLGGGRWFLRLLYHLDGSKPSCSKTLIRMWQLSCLFAQFVVGVSAQRNVNRRTGLQTVRGLTGVGVAEAIGLYGVSARQASGVF